MHMVKDEIVKWLINENFILKSSDVKGLTYKQLVKKYQDCIKKHEKIKEHLDSTTSNSIM